VLIAAEDYDTWLRLAKHTEAFARIDKPLGCYWGGGGNVSDPERTITNLTRLRERYAAELSEWGGNPLPGWMAYSLVRVHYLTYDLDKVCQYSKIALYKVKNWQIKCKSLIGWMLIKVKGLV